eukprot:8673010-Pyramimonas_sp.AAC.1
MRCQAEVSPVSGWTSFSADRRVRPRASSYAYKTGATRKAGDYVLCEETGGQDLATGFGRTVRQGQRRVAVSRCGHIYPRGDPTAQRETPSPQATNRLEPHQQPT